MPQLVLDARSRKRPQTDAMSRGNGSQIDDVRPSAARLSEWPLRGIGAAIERLGACRRLQEGQFFRVHSAIMYSNPSVLARLSDDQLLSEVKRLVQRECQATADLIASLVELDRRSLYVAQGYSSLFAYCTEALGLSEDAAYFRIEAVRAALRFPTVLERLEQGAVTLTAVKMLRPHLTEENHRDLLDAARGKSKRAVEEMIATLQPRPDVPSLVRKLPASRTTMAASVTSISQTTRALVVANDRLVAEARVPERECERALRPPAVDARSAIASPASRPAVVEPLAPERYKVQMTVSAETHARLRRAQDLLRHVVPDGDPAAIFDRALVVLLERLERTKWAATKRTRSGDDRQTSRKDRRRSTSAVTCQLAGTAVPGAVAADHSDGKDRELAAPESAARPDRAHTLPSAGTRRNGSEVDQAQHVPERVERRVPRKRSRHIPADVRRAVWSRDGGRCTFVGWNGHRCGERSLLEFHHVVPFAAGGDMTASNLTLRCRRHNGFDAERFFGRRLPPPDA